MNSFLKKIVVVLIFVAMLGSAILPATTFAQVDNDESNAEATGGRTTVSTTDQQRADNPSGTTITSGDRLTPEVSGSASSKSSQTWLNGKGICSNWITDFSLCLGWTFFSVGTWFAEKAGQFLNFSIEVSILNMRTIVNNIGVVNVAWDVLRDLANIFFIFILIYIAIITIVGMAGGQTKRMLINVILVAMFINFSLFFTKVIVDASNIVTVQFYNSITKGDSTANNGISWVFTEGSRLPSLFRTPQNDLSAFRNDGPYIIYGLMALIFCLILSFAFLAIGILFVIRLVMMMYLMVLSPFAFLGLTVSKLNGVWDKWWSTLINQAIFAPVMMLMLWVTAMIMNSEGFISAMQLKNLDVSFSNLVMGTTGGQSALVMVNFAVLIAFLFGGMIIAKQFGTWGSGAVVDTTMKWARRSAYVAGGAGIARWGVGAATKNLGKNYDKLASRVANSDSMVARGIRGVGKIPIAGNIASGIVKDVDRGIKSTLEKGQKLNFGLGETFKERNTALDEREGELSVMARKDKNKNEAKDSSAKINNLKTKEAERIRRGEQLTDEEKKELRDAEMKLQSAISRMSDKEIEEIASKDMSFITSKEVMASLSTRQIEYLKKTDKLSDGEKDAIMAAREKPIKEAIEALGKADENGSHKLAKQVITAIAEKELEIISTDLLNNPTLITELTQSQFESLTKSNNLTKLQKDVLKEERLRPIKLALLDPEKNPLRSGEVRPTPQSAIERIQKMNPEGISNLDTDILKNSLVIDKILNSSSVLAKMSPKMSREKVTEVRNAIINRLDERTKPTSAEVVSKEESDKIEKLHEWLESTLGRQNFS